MVKAVVEGLTEPRFHELRVQFSAEHGPDWWYDDGILHRFTQACRAAAAQEAASSTASEPADDASSFGGARGPGWYGAPQQRKE